MYKSTQTRPKFLWRFFSCQQFKYFIVIASSEQEARSMLPDSPCLFSARFAEGESVWIVYSPIIISVYKLKLTKCLGM
nr:host cell division inhibitor Icd-like protein [Providencia rustigianii]